MLSISKSSPANSLFAKTITTIARFSLFIFVGICYWVMVEVIQSGLIHTFDASITIGYLVAMACAWCPIVWLLWRFFEQDKTYLHQLHQLHKDTNQNDILDIVTPTAHSTCHIEHTPVYQNFHPKYQ